MLVIDELDSQHPDVLRRHHNGECLLLLCIVLQAEVQNGPLILRAVADGEQKRGIERTSQGSDDRIGGRTHRVPQRMRPSQGSFVVLAGSDREAGAGHPGEVEALQHEPVLVERPGDYELPGPASSAEDDGYGIISAEPAGGIGVYVDAIIDAILMEIPCLSACEGHLHGFDEAEVHGTGESGVFRRVVFQFESNVGSFALAGDLFDAEHSGDRGSIRPSERHEIRTLVTEGETVLPLCGGSAFHQPHIRCLADGEHVSRVQDVRIGGDPVDVFLRFDGVWACIRSDERGRT